MSERREDLRASARVKLTLEIDCNDGWGVNCKMDQVHDQAIQSAVGKMRRLVEKEPGVRIVGEPKVLMVIASWRNVES